MCALIGKRVSSGLRASIPGGGSFAEPISDQLQELAARKLPEAERLIERAEAMRNWLRTAESGPRYSRKARYGGPFAFHERRIGA